MPLKLKESMNKIIVDKFNSGGIGWNTDLGWYAIIYDNGEFITEKNDHLVIK